jgi:hypothetical protein
VKDKLKAIWTKVVIYLRPFANWRFLISFGSSWVITNGIWYVLAFAPFKFIPSWLRGFAAAYIGILWLPATPEKFFITLPLAIWIHIRIFRNDEKTRLLLEKMLKEAKEDWEKLKNKFKKNKS